jgi:hypothetical protein
MIIPMLISSSLFILPVKDTVWWNTPGGKVTGHSDHSTKRCSLMLYNDDGSVMFEWDDQGRILVIASGRNWQFPDDTKVPVAMQLGDAWLKNRDGSAVIEAVGHETTIGFATDQAVDELLRPADHILVISPDVELSIKVTPAKMGVLLSRTARCRESTRR